VFDEILERHPFFHQLKPAQLLEMARHCEQVSYEAGKYIFKESRPADRFFLILNGQVALEIHDPGRDALIIQTLIEEDLLGWSWLFPPYRWHFDARAVTAVRLLAIEGSWLRQQIEGDPAFGYLFMTRVAQIILDRLQATRLQLMDIHSHTANRLERRRSHERPGNS
jgi:CRP-like cAMP-binding protein